MMQFKKTAMLLVFGIGLFSATYAQKVKKTVFVIVDGIASDLIEKLQTPNLHAIAGKQGFSKSYVGGIKGGYSETPTISAVGYNSELTGTWVNKHNVWDNDIAAPNYNYYTIFRYLKQQDPSKKTAIFSSWEDNRTKLVGDNFAPTGNIAVDHHYDGLENDTVNFPHDKKRDFMSNIDESVSQHAADYIKSDAPDLTWVYLEYTDDMGHMHGDSPEYYKAIELADKRVGYLWQAIQYREKNFNEEWLIVITTDHGRDKATGKNHGGQSDRERASWIVTNAKNLNEEFKEPQLSAVDIMPSITRFMGINVPQQNAFEVDGIPFIGQISFTQPAVAFADGKVNINWKAVQKKGNVKVLVSTTNQFKKGGKDEYTELGSAPLAGQKASFKLPESSTGFYKVVLQADGNNYNYWSGKSPE